MTPAGYKQVAIIKLGLVRATEKAFAGKSVPEAAINVPTAFLLTQADGIELTWLELALCPAAFTAATT